MLKMQTVTVQVKCIIVVFLNLRDYIYCFNKNEIRFYFNNSNINLEY